MMPNRYQEREDASGFVAARVMLRDPTFDPEVVKDNRPVWQAARSAPKR